eukprot:3697278-Pyramimonas_sp.AAC.1
MSLAARSASTNARRRPRSCTTSSAVTPAARWVLQPRCYDWAGPGFDSAGTTNAAFRLRGRTSTVDRSRADESPPGRFEPI